MAKRQSKIYEKIKDAVKSKKLKQPFNVADVNKCCKNLLIKSPSFLSKHADGNPRNYFVYFIRDGDGRYRINE